MMYTRAVVRKQGKKWNIKYFRMYGRDQGLYLMSQEVDSAEQAWRRCGGL